MVGDEGETVADADGNLVTRKSCVVDVLYDSNTLEGYGEQLLTHSKDDLRQAQAKSYRNLPRFVPLLSSRRHFRGTTGKEEAVVMGADGTRHAEPTTEDRRYHKYDEDMPEHADEPPPEWDAWVPREHRVHGYRPPAPPTPDGTFFPYEDPADEVADGSAVGTAPDAQGVLPDMLYEPSAELFSVLPQVSDLLSLKRNLAAYRQTQYDLVNRAGAAGAIHAIAARLKSSGAATARLALGGIRDTERPVSEGPPLGLPFDGRMPKLHTGSGDRSGTADSAEPEPDLEPQRRPVTPLGRLLSSEAAGSAVNLPLSMEDLSGLLRFVRHLTVRGNTHVVASLCGTVAAATISSVAWHPLSMVKKGDYDAVTGALKFSMQIGSYFGRQLPSLPKEMSFVTTDPGDAARAVEAWREDSGGGGLRAALRRAIPDTDSEPESGAGSAPGQQISTRRRREPKAGEKAGAGAGDGAGGTSKATGGGTQEAGGSSQAEAEAEAEADAEAEAEADGGDIEDEDSDELIPIPPVVYLHPMMECYVAWVGLPAAYCSLGYEGLIRDAEAEPDADIGSHAKVSVEREVEAGVRRSAEVSKLLDGCSALPGYFDRYVNDRLGDGYWLEFYGRCLSVSRVQYKTSAVNSLVIIEQKHRRTAPPSRARQDTEALWSGAAAGASGTSSGGGAATPGSPSHGQLAGSPGNSGGSGSDVDHPGDDEFWARFDVDDGGPLAPKRRPRVVLPGMEAVTSEGLAACTNPVSGRHLLLAGANPAERSIASEGGSQSAAVDPGSVRLGDYDCDSESSSIIPLPGCLKVSCREQMQYAAFLVGSRVLERCFGEPENETDDAEGGGGGGGGGDLHQQLIGRTKDLWVFLARVGRLRPAQVTHLFKCSAGQHHSVARPLLHLLLAIVPSLPRGAREGVAALVGQIPFAAWTDVTIQFCRDLSCVCIRADRHEVARRRAERAAAIADGAEPGALDSESLPVRLYAVPLLWRYMHDGSCCRATRARASTAVASAGGSRSIMTRDRSNGGAPPLAQVSTALAAIADIVHYMSSGCGEQWTWRPLDVVQQHPHDMSGPFSEEHQKEQSGGGGSGSGGEGGSRGLGGTVDVMEGVGLTEVEKQHRRSNTRTAVHLTHGLQWPQESSVQIGITSPDIEAQERAALEQRAARSDAASSSSSSPSSSSTRSSSVAAPLVLRPHVDDVFRFPMLPELPLRLDEEARTPGLGDDMIGARLPNVFGVPTNAASGFRRVKVDGGGGGSRSGSGGETVF